MLAIVYRTVFHPCQGLPVSLLSMLLALSGAGVLAAGVILKSYMAKKEDLPVYQNITDEELEKLQFYVGLIEKTEYIVIGYGAWSSFVGLMGMVTFIANFVNKYTCIFDGNCSRVILTAMYARNVVQNKPYRYGFTMNDLDTVRFMRYMSRVRPLIAIL